MSANRRSLRASEIKWYLVQEEDAKVFIFKNNKQLKNREGQDLGEAFLTSSPLEQTLVTKS